LGISGAKAACRRPQTVIRGMVQQQHLVFVANISLCMSTAIALVPTAICWSFSNLLWLFDFPLS
jgi:hypothetical protein